MDPLDQDRRLGTRFPTWTRGSGSTSAPMSCTDPPMDLQEEKGQKKKSSFALRFGGLCAIENNVGKFYKG